jgi:peptide/nickel transport system substrate-binding protein
VTSIDELPVGTVTFLFTDIEGSTQLLKQLGGELYGQALDEHRRILRTEFADHDGREIDTQGDSFFVAFRRAKDAINAAIACQRDLAAHAWPQGCELRVRMGIHTGEPAMGSERYVGMGVHRAARICAAGHGGQVLVSQTTRELMRDDPLPDVSLRDLGEHQLKDMDEPERIFQLVARGLREDFPELKTAAPAPFEGREGELAEAAAEEMAKPWRRPGRRVLVGATFAAAVVGLGIGVLLTQGGGSTAGAGIAANAVGVVDSDSGRIVAEVPVGSAPAEIAVSPDAVWVTNVNEKLLTRVDPATNQVVQTIQVGDGPTGIAVGGGAVWVANGLDGTVSRIDPATNRKVQDISVGNGPNGIAYGEGAVWVTNSTDGTVSRIDPNSTRAPRTFPAAVGAGSIAIGFRRVWIASPPSATVVVLDPRTGRLVKEIGVGGEPSAVAVGTEAVWVANRADGTVSRIDPQAATVRDVVPVGRAPGGIAASADGVWVADELDGTLTHLDPTTGEPGKTVALDNPARSVAVMSSGVYVAVQSTGVEHRGGTLRALSAFSGDFIDPALAYGEGGTWLMLSMTNDGLVGFRKVAGVEGTQLIPDLAVALPAATDGGRAYTFEVRRGIHYSDGKTVRPEDFKWAIERLFEMGSPGVPYYTGIVGADGCRSGKPCNLDRGITVDRAARTITFRLVAPDAEFLSKLAIPFAFSVPLGTPARDMEAQPVPATGPYRVETFSKKSKLIRLVRNESFRAWSPDAQPDGYPDSITISWRFGFDTTALVRAVERGAADIALDNGPPIPNAELDRLAIRYPARLPASTALSTYFFFLNTRVPPFDDLRVRRAVSLAFDRDAFAHTIERAGSTTCQILPPNLQGYRPTCPFTPGGKPRLDAARALVRSSGSRGEFVTVWTPAAVVAQAQYLASVLRSLGYRTRVRAQSIPDHFTSVNDPKTRAQAGFYAWIADFPSAAGFIPPQFGCNVPTNVSGLCDPSIDAMMARASATQVSDPAAATKLWQQIELAILAQAPVVPTYNTNNIDFLSERVGNYQYNPQLGVLLGQLWVK